MEFIPVDFATEINGTSTSKVVSTSLLSQKLFDFEKRTTDYSAVVANFGRIWYRTDTHLFKTVGKNSDGSYEVRGLTTDDYVCAQINQPTITTASGDIYSGQVFSSSAFSVFGGSDVHISSSWEIRNNSDTLITNLYNSTSSKTSWTPDLSSLSANTTIKARVLHKGSTFGESTWSNYVVFYFKMPVVNTPTGLSATSDQTSVTMNSTFSCTPAGVIAHYSSQWQISTSSSFNAIIQDTGESTSSRITHTFSGLSENTTYYWRVKHKGDNGAWSAYTTGQTNATTDYVINTPTGLSATSDQTSVTANCTFSSTPSGATHYSSRWQISTSSSFSSILQDTGECTSSRITHTFSGLVAETTYYWRVKTKSSTGVWSAYTSEQTKATTGSVGPSSVLAFFSNVFTESPSNDGSVTGEMVGTITGTANFVADLTGLVDFSAIPTGLTPVVTRNNDQGCSITFTGTASSHAEPITSSVTFQSGAFNENVTGVTSSIYFDFFTTDPYLRMSLIEIWHPFDRYANVESDTQYITLYNDTFRAGDLSFYIIFDNVPSYFDVSVVRLSNNLLGISFTDNDTTFPKPIIRSDRTITYTFLDGAFVNTGATNVLNYSDNFTLREEQGSYEILMAASGKDGIEISSDGGTISIRERETIGILNHANINDCVVTLPTGFSYTISKTTGEEEWVIEITGTADPLESVTVSLAHTCFVSPLDATMVIGSSQTFEITDVSTASYVVANYLQILDSRGHETTPVIIENSPLSNNVFSSDDTITFGRLSRYGRRDATSNYIEYRIIGTGTWSAGVNVGDISTDLPNISTNRIYDKVLRIEFSNMLGGTLSLGDAGIKTISFLPTAFDIPVTNLRTFDVLFVPRRVHLECPGFTLASDGDGLVYRPCVPFNIRKDNVPYWKRHMFLDWKKIPTRSISLGCENEIDAYNYNDITHSKLSSWWYDYLDYDYLGVRIRNNAKTKNLLGYTFYGIGALPRTIDVMPLPGALTDCVGPVYNRTYLGNIISNEVQLVLTLGKAGYFEFWTKLPNGFVNIDHFMVALNYAKGGNFSYIITTDKISLERTGQNVKIRMYYSSWVYGVPSSISGGFGMLEEPYLTMNFNKSIKVYDPETFELIPFTECPFYDPLPVTLQSNIYYSSYFVAVSSRISVKDLFFSQNNALYIRRLDTDYGSVPVESRTNEVNFNGELRAKGGITAPTSWNCFDKQASLTLEYRQKSTEVLEWWISGEFVGDPTFTSLSISTAQGTWTVNLTGYISKTLSQL